MKAATRIFLAIFLLLAAAHRLPAPISEVPEKPAVPPENAEQSHKPKSRAAERGKSRTREKTNRGESVKVAPAVKSAGFAGTWSGIINQGIVGTGSVALTMNANGTEVKEKSSYGSFVRHGTCDGQTASWKGGAFGDLNWTFTPNPDGQTARVTARGLFSGNTSVTFTRTQTASDSSAISQAAISVAQPVPNKPGFVYSPSDPKIILDVRGKASGTKAWDGSGRQFIVP